MELTKSEIQNDIQNFEGRISIARQKLADLPEGFLPFGEHKKREQKRYDLESEIKHIQKIIEIATGALNES